MNQSSVAADVSRLRLIERNDIRADLRRLLQFMLARRVRHWSSRSPMNPAQPYQVHGQNRCFRLLVSGPVWQERAYSPEPEPPRTFEKGSLLGRSSVPGPVHVFLAGAGSQPAVAAGFGRPGTG